MRKSLLFVVLPTVSISELMPDDTKLFTTKIKPDIPLGVLSLASYIEKYNNVKAYILDLNLKFSELCINNKFDKDNTPEDYIFRFMEEYREKEIDFCGISALFCPAYGYLEIVSRASKIIFGQETVVAAGGGVPSNLMKEVFVDAPCVDIISYGEGEIALSGFVGTENEKEYLINSKSLMTREKIENNFEYEFEFIHNLDEIPTLNISLIEFEKYNNYVHKQDKKKVIAMPLMFSRGCPFNCCFCASHSIHGKRVRYNSIERIKADVDMFVKKYNVNTIIVWDDNFFVDRAQGLALLNYFSNMNLTVEFVNGLPVYCIDDEIASSLKQAGIDYVTLAIESGNEKVLREIIHKPLTLDMVPKAIQCLEKNNIYTKGLFVIGFPGETLEDIKITMDFINESRLRWASIFIASPLPGSELYDICIRRKLLKNNNLETTSYLKGNIETKEFTPEQLEDIQVYNTIKKDYVNNLDMQEKKWESALINFEFVINAKHENPFAYYYAAIAARELGIKEKEQEYFTKYSFIRENNRKWEELFQRFILEGISF